MIRHFATEMTARLSCLPGYFSMFVWEINTVTFSTELEMLQPSRIAHCLVVSKCLLIQKYLYKQCCKIT